MRRRYKAVTVTGHTKGEDTRSYCLYTVWKNKMDELVIADAEAKDCAKAMGVKLGTFYGLLCKSRKHIGKWHIEKRFIDGGKQKYWEEKSKGVWQCE